MTKDLHRFACHEIMGAADLRVVKVAQLGWGEGVNVHNICRVGGRIGEGGR